MRRDYESRLIHQIDHNRMRDVDSLLKPFKLRYEPGVSAPLGIDAIDPSVREFFCIHGVPYLFKDSRNKCRRCIK